MLFKTAKFRETYCRLRGNFNSYPYKLRKVTNYGQLLKLTLTTCTTNFVANVEYLSISKFVTYWSRLTVS
jgi:hypothetical protein